jgi:Secretion system C-terminal sorting domain
MKHLYHLLFTLLLPCSIFCQQQQTITFSPGKDNTIYEENVNSNAKGQNIFAGKTGPQGGPANRRALLYFPVVFPTPLTPGQTTAVTVISASLTLYCTKEVYGPANVSLHKLSADWGEGTSDAGSSSDGTGVAPTPNDATWQDRFYTVSQWATPGGNYAATASATTSVGVQGVAYTWTSAQMAADVQNWSDNPAANFGWIVIGDEANLSTAKRFGSRENTTVTFRPVLTVTYLGPVPVTLTSFAAKETAKGIQLNWQTQQELNNAWFDVQHSYDGVRFNNIGRITGAGNSAVVKNYQFIHEGTAPGQNFYRLAQTDFDGKVNYSQVVQLSTKGTHYTINISPNPVTNSIQLTGSAYQKGNAYTVFSQNGTAVLQGKLQSASINTASLTTGAYILQLEQQGGTALYGRFIKQ